MVLNGKQKEKVSLCIVQKKLSLQSPEINFQGILKCYLQCLFCLYKLLVLSPND